MCPYKRAHFPQNYGIVFDGRINTRIIIYFISNHLQPFFFPSIISDHSERFKTRMWMRNLALDLYSGWYRTTDEIKKKSNLHGGVTGTPADQYQISCNYTNEINIGNGPQFMLYAFHFGCGSGGKYVFEIKNPHFGMRCLRTEDVKIGLNYVWCCDE